MSTFGSIFRVTTFGESHCKGVGVIIDNCPPGLVLSEADVQPQLTRRRPGQSDLTTPRNESDTVTIYSGVEKGVTLGTPIMMLVPNKDQRPHDYGEMDLYPRPSHADMTYLQKYGVKASSGGGRSSARETTGRVAASAVAEKYLGQAHGIEIVAFVSAVGNVSMAPLDEFPEGEGKEKESEWMATWKNWWTYLKGVKRSEVDSNEVRCPDATAAANMRERIVRARDAQDSIGGVVTCVIRNLPIGLGEPCFDKLEGKLAHAMLSIPATKAFEIGSGMAGTQIPGHVHNDPFVLKEGGKMGTSTNFSGGIQGGISNGEDVYFKVGFKSVATIGQPQETATYSGKGGVLEAKGRHDPCVLPRAVPIVESMAALVVMDMLMLQMSRVEAKRPLPRDQIPSVMKGELEKDLSK